ncbi:hypothetical protein HCG65_01595 [Streptococcus anginosus]|uniref:hypothetical protein n=1 Tax=Streptococcus anginosus TaxID=1328 RepID=UPI001C8B8339|nr:hypothetical protein [Streptococcus anginosus]MBX9075244.1 hypothetical protein [Streptococcus anginosus]
MAEKESEAFVNLAVFFVADFVDCTSNFKSSSRVFASHAACFLVPIVGETAGGDCQIFDVH